MIKAYTHGGTFHMDDVASAWLLGRIFGEYDLERVFKVPEDTPEDAIIFDIGWGKYDHHQKDAEVRPNGIKYAAFGLLWREFGKKLVDETAFEIFDRSVVQPIDAQDNGQKPESDIPILSLSSAIGFFNPNWDEESNKDAQDAAFMRAVSCAALVLDQALESAMSKARAKSLVDAAVQKFSEGTSCVVVLDKFAPWQEWILKNPAAETALYVAFPSNRGGWHLQAIPTKLGSFDNRKPLPETWAGKSADELQKLTNVQDFTFCHNGRFLAACDSLESCLTLAEIARNA